jgi:Peptidase family M23
VAGRKAVVSMRRLVCALVLAAVVPCVAGWTWPVRGPVLQSFSFDPAHPYAAGEHRGIAIGASTGAPVVAPASGTVSFAGTVPTNGKSVTIVTPSGLAVSLTHLGSIVVAENASVAEGDVVGAVGPSGTPELAVPYVHLGIRQAANDQGYLDPLGFLPVLAPPPTPQPEPEPAPAATPAPLPATPPAASAPAVAAPQPASPPAPAPASALPAEQPTASPILASGPPPVPVAEAPSAPGVAVRPAATGARPGVSVKPLPVSAVTVPLAPRQEAPPVVAPAMSGRPATVIAAPRAVERPAATARALHGRAPGKGDVPPAVRPPRAPSLTVAPEAGAHGAVQFVIGLGALAAAVFVALLWIRWRLRPDDRQERTALV